MSTTKSAGVKSLLDVVNSFDENRKREYRMFMERGMVKQAERWKKCFKSINFDE